MILSDTYYAKNDKKLFDIKDNYNKYIQNILKEKNLELLINNSVNNHKQEYEIF